MVHGSQNRGSWASWGPTIIFSEKKSPYLNNLSLDHIQEPIVGMFICLSVQVKSEGYCFRDCAVLVFSPLGNPRCLVFPRISPEAGSGLQRYYWEDQTAGIPYWRNKKGNLGKKSSPCSINTQPELNSSWNLINKLASLEATLVRNYDPLNHLITDGGKV